MPDLETTANDEILHPRGPALSSQGEGQLVAVQALAVKYVSPSTLTPYAKNARTHTRAQIRKVADSILEYGFTNPVLVDGKGMIVAGHCRVEAAKLLKLQTVPTIRLEGLSAAQVRAYILADNRMAIEAGWNREVLQIELQEILMEGLIDIELTGFDLPEIEVLLDAGQGGDQAESLPPQLPPPVSKLGDLWALGAHRILCADARDGAAVELMMGDEKASIVFTDPPFNVPVSGHVSGNGRVHHPEFAMAAGEMTDAEFTEFLRHTLGLLAAHSKDGAVHYVCMDWRGADKLMAAGKLVYNELLNVCVWAKPAGGMGSFYRSQHEFVYVYRHGAARHENNVQLGRFGRNRTNVWHYPSASTLSRAGTEGDLLAMHPTVKPIAMVADALLDASSRGDLVVDTFLGAGTTLLAAERVGRRCFAMEINPRYVDLAIQRWEQTTGEKAHRIAISRDDSTRDRGVE